MRFLVCLAAHNLGEENDQASNLGISLILSCLAPSEVCITVTVNDRHGWLMLLCIRSLTDLFIVIVEGAPICCPQQSPSGRYTV